MKAGKIVSEFDLSHSPERVYRLKFADRAQAAAALARAGNANLRQEGSLSIIGARGGSWAIFSWNIASNFPI